ncbi:CDX1_4 [Lepeophtheirus salmonis]|uniref:CDX1_4 n=1 Tax=Lepeophtheirus salmonis TaxID=72036 RepID=A0A7R8CW77_LEPSM|nr:CDX1_4 [Lepeophtheirus salmonis]CAF2900777.1 CDX1_4 [Lepeophtheirus salmonis]
MFHSGGTPTPSTDNNVSPTPPASLPGSNSCLGPKHHHQISPPPPPAFVPGSYLSGYGSYYTHHHHAHSHHHHGAQEAHQSTTTPSSTGTGSALGSLYSDTNIHSVPPSTASHHQLHPSQWYSSSHHFANPFYPDWSSPHPSSFLSDTSESQPYSIHHPSASTHGSSSYFKSSPYAFSANKAVKGDEESILKSTEDEDEEDEKDDILLEESHSLTEVQESQLQHHHISGEAPLTKGKGLGPFDWISNSSKRSLKSSSSIIGAAHGGGGNGKEGSSRTRTKDKYRVVYSDHQRLELEKEFHYSRYITIRRKAELATNRRAKERKQLKKRDEIVGGKETPIGGSNNRGSHSGLSSSNNGPVPISTHPLPSGHHIHPLESGLHHSMAFNPAAAAVMLSHRHHHPYTGSSGHHGTPRDVLSSLATSPPSSS